MTWGQLVSAAPECFSSVCCLQSHLSAVHLVIMAQTRTHNSDAHLCISALPPALPAPGKRLS
jgi:hypothetical protein